MLYGVMDKCSDSDGKLTVWLKFSFSLKDFGLFKGNFNRYRSSEWTMNLKGREGGCLHIFTGGQICVRIYEIVSIVI